MNRDYRNSRYCPKLDNVILRKNILQDKIKSRNIKLKDFYLVLSQKKLPYRQEFAEIYNKKCAYCGVSYKIESMFEIDHYICKSSFSPGEDAGQLSNLVYSCYHCNRHKSNFKINKLNSTLLNPDTRSINKVFIRTDDYDIQIQKAYRNNDTVQNFYKKLHFSFDLRRLDYLLLCIWGLYTKMKNETDKSMVAEALNLLKERRNVFIDKGLT